MGRISRNNIKLAVYAGLHIYSMVFNRQGSLWRGMYLLQIMWCERVLYDLQRQQKLPWVMNILMK